MLGDVFEIAKITKHKQVAKRMKFKRTNGRLIPIA